MAVIKDHVLLADTSNFMGYISDELQKAYNLIENSKNESAVIKRIKTVEELLRLLNSLDSRIEIKIRCMKQAAAELKMEDHCSELIAELAKKSFDVLELIEDAKKIKLSAFITSQDYNIRLNYIIDTFDAGGVCMHNEITVDSEKIRSKFYLNEIEKIQELQFIAVIWTKRNVHLTLKEAASIIRSHFKDQLNAECEMGTH